MKKAFIIFISIMLLLFACSCNDSEETKTSSSNETVTKITEKTKKTKKSNKSLTLYFCYSDSLDPYKSQSSGNQALCSLLFDSLTKLDSNLNSKKLIANNIEIDGKTVRISINNYRFSDGSYITYDDVIYSIEKCKKSKYGAFVNQLENVKSYTSSGNEIILTLAHEDKNIANILDFPILKRGTADKTNSDGKPIPPIGSGRYVLVDNKGNFSLKGNDYYFDKKPENKINLKNIPDYDSLEFLIRSNSINVYYSGFDSKEMPNLKTSNENVPLTNLVYLGLNQTVNILKNNEIRKAISLAVNRNNIAEKCYYSLSKPALSLYNDKNNIIDEQNNIFSANDKISSAKELISQSGFKTIGSDGYYKNRNNEHITISFLYNKDNNAQSMVASTLLKQLKACGIEVKEDARDETSYKNAIKKGDYEMYLAEIRLNKSFDYTSLLNTKIKLTKKDKFLSDYQKYLKGLIDIKEMLDSFEEEMPFIPIVFRLGTVSTFGNFSEELISSISDPYYNIEKIYLK